MSDEHDHEHEDEDESEGAEEARQVPEGAAVFPLIPAELGIDPVFLALLHAIVFVAGSTPEVIHPAASDETIQYMAEYLRRLDGDRLRRVNEDMACLIDFARQEKWPRQDIQSLKTLFADLGVEKEGEA
jgi:hypothetical protein